MIDEETCKYNQTGFCKFRQNCQKRHEQTICQENHDYKSMGCSLRHPKVCKSYEKEGTCRFKDECAYKHQNNLADAMNSSHTQEIKNIQQEMNQMKSMILQMENKIEILKNIIQDITQTNVEEIVAIVVSSLERTKEIENNVIIETVNKAQDSFNCDKCSFKCNEEWSIIRHMSQEHGECSSCDFCGTYFGTKHLLQKHNEKEHNHDKQDEDSSEEESKISEHECKQCTYKSKNSNDLQWHMEKCHESKKSKKKQKNKKK